MKLKLLPLILTLISTFSFADGCENWGCESTIEMLYTTVNGDIYIGTPLDERKANCSPISNVYFTLNPQSNNAAQVYSSLLSAYMSDKKIVLRIKEGHPKCELEYVQLKSK
ncbi:hypothetical protein GTG28_00670 [Vibrio sp. OCN044]|uniref:Uncharacterized protein n=1 Tax=Vibrio tetraodonis subsp. pristinus TaxID=2695891 RepID=A0A6L8LRJ2_9VIBR|nr:hypothetical protein [Vibrio tetraodonis]MYM57746.1 hypothetical protein [Vibrio tetraodonis subsp. pristinus]